MDEADLLEMKQCRGVVVASAVFGSASRDTLSYFVINRSSRVANFYVCSDEDYFSFQMLLMM